jgi:hypothetical protein
MYRSTFSLPRHYLEVSDVYSQGKRPRYPLDRKLAGPQSRSRRLGEQKILAPHRDSNFDPSIVQIVASRYTDDAILAPQIGRRENKNVSSAT